MTLFLPRITQIAKAISFVLVFVCCSQHMLGQVTCSPAFVVNICPTAEAAVGTQTSLGATYNWFKDGKVKRGPIAGDGGAVSINFPINSIDDAGFYTIEQTVNGVTTCAA
ncbi:MAG: hypothetical protein H7Y31_09430, partial [Chitinophagaceae bacterium]|nr:hypothetical protein [Chitinophagaceae bacterium]